MAIDPSLPKDPVAAQQLLAALVIKDQNEAFCRYPTCPEPRKAAENGGKPPAYCGNATHTPQRNFRARAFLKALAAGLAPTSLETEQPASVLTVQSLRDTTLEVLATFQHQLGLYVAAISELADPEMAAFQIQAAEHRAAARVAEAQELVNTERALRLAAENARTAAQQEAGAEREAAALAIARMNEAQEGAQVQRAEHERHIAEIQQERATAIEEIREEAEQRIAEVQQRASKDIAQAQDLAAVAQEEARQANARAHDAQTEARARVASAEQLVAEAHAARQREQDEVARLRHARDAVAAEARTRAETDRNEIRQLRAELAEAIAQARTRAEDDRAEIQQLRAHLTAATRRADDLALVNDTLRSQFLQMGEAERSEKKE
jgi:colicin import membrane protein